MKKLIKQKNLSALNNISKVFSLGKDFWQGYWQGEAILVAPWHCHYVPWGMCSWEQAFLPEPIKSCPVPITTHLSHSGKSIRTCGCKIVLHNQSRRDPEWGDLFHKVTFSHQIWSVWKNTDVPEKHWTEKCSPPKAALKIQLCCFKVHLVMKTFLKMFVSIIRPL